jgi:hypothetical protein
MGASLKEKECRILLHSLYIHKYTAFRIHCRESIMRKAVFACGSIKGGLAAASWSRRAYPACPDLPGGFWWFMLGIALIVLGIQHLPQKSIFSSVLRYISITALTLEGENGLWSSVSQSEQYQLCEKCVLL